MERTIELGKVAYTGKTKMHPATFSLKLTDDGRFSCCAEIWNHIRTDCYVCGQCIETVAEYFPKNKLVNTIVRLWKSYHLNDMHAGTPKQEEVLNALDSFPRDYDDRCKYLESIGLLVDNGYKYGSAWLRQEIPADDLALIKRIIETGKL